MRSILVKNLTARFHAYSDLINQIDDAALVERIEGLSAKVLNDCLRRLVEFKVLEKRSYAEIPPRVEYDLTEFGMKFRKTLDALDALEADFEVAKASTRRIERSATVPSGEIISADDDSA